MYHDYKTDVYNQYGKMLTDIGEYNIEVDKSNKLSFKCVTLCIHKNAITMRK